MSFGAPGYVLLLLLMPVALVVVAIWARWRARAAERFGSRRRGRGEDVRVYVSAALIVFALALTGFAAARPQVGSHAARVEDRGVDLAVALDVSQSMLSTDAQPSRLGRAQAEISALLDRLRGERAGLVMFAGQPLLRMPLTSDLTAVGAVVARIDGERGLVEPGSDLGAAIRSATSLLARGQAGTKVMLIVSDGEDRTGDVVPALDEARRAGIRVYTAGVGTARGAPVLDDDPVAHSARPRLDASGALVLTHLNATALREIASAGGGRYIELGGSARPLAGLAPELASLPRTTFGARQSPQRIERFQGVAAAALLVVMSATLIPIVARAGWRRSLRVPRRLWPLAGAGLLIGAICSSGVAGINRDGNRLYERGEYRVALDRYRQAQAFDALRGEIYYNASNALGRIGEYDRAVGEARRALPAREPDLDAKLQYSIGNHSVGAGEFADAIEAYKRALLADPDDTDAKHNLEVVTSRLRQPPAPRPTPSPKSEQPTAGENSEQGQYPTPQPDRGATSPATPSASNGQATPGPSDRLAPQDVQRSLDEALRGLDQQFTDEQAMRILDLLDRANRQDLGRQTGSGTLGQPDY